MAERIDGVVVAGAGPVGLVIALKLARAGVRVLVVDAAPRIIEEPRAVVDIDAPRRLVVFVRERGVTRAPRWHRR